VSDPGFETAAWSWVDHLRSGGTTTWREWRSLEHPAVPVRGSSLPSAAQLEVVRRLAEGEDGGANLARLADLVTGTPVGGRGLVDAPLPWPTSTPIGGAPAVEPDALPANELLRVCVAAIVRTILHDVQPPARPARMRRRPWRRAFVVEGTSPHAVAVREALLGAGQVEGGRRPTVLVVGGPLDAMMATHWRLRVEAGAGARWRRVWSGSAARGTLPSSVDVAALAEGWASRVGADKVHVVLEREPAGAVAAAGRVLDLRLDPVEDLHSDVVRTDLLRRINQALAIRGPETARAFREGTFGEYLFRSAPGRPLGVPRPQLAWAREQAQAMVIRLGAAGYAVHGDPRVVVPSCDPALRRSVDPADTLRHALLALAGCESLTRATGWSPSGSREGEY
jgi:hypothetical protein